MNRIGIFVGLIFVLALSGRVGAQDYKQTILEYRKQYIKDLMAEPRLGFKPGDERYFKFFEPDEHYCVWATFTPTPGKSPFKIATHSGKEQPFKEFGYLEFKIGDTPLVLHVYQSVDMMTGMPRNDDLFIPFCDYTNYETTYGGGRYIDLKIYDIKNGRILLDFNKCYNPYCAYGGVFSCPIPPDENRLNIEIRAGDKMYEKFMGR